MDIPPSPSHSPPPPTPTTTTPPPPPPTTTTTPLPPSFDAVSRSGFGGPPKTSLDESNERGCMSLNHLAVDICYYWPHKTSPGYSREESRKPDFETDAKSILRGKSNRNEGSSVERLSFGSVSLVSFLCRAGSALVCPSDLGE